jgi:hypothetical protein
VERKLQSLNPGVAQQFARSYGVLTPPQTSDRTPPSAGRLKGPTVSDESRRSARTPPGTRGFKAAKAGLAFSFEAWLDSVRTSRPAEE